MPPVTNTPDDTTVASLYHQWRESLDRGELQTATYIAGPHAHLIDLLQQRINEHFSCSAAQQDETLTQEAQTATNPVVKLPQVPGFTVLGLLGRGGMGAVYHVRDAVNREWAMKLVREDRLTPTAKARFFGEAFAMARLEHPNIIHVQHYHEPHSSNDVPYMLLPVYPSSLHQKLAIFQSDTRKAVRLLAGIAAGVGYLHNNGLIHRDIKPHNILLTKNDDPIVSDFGLVKDLIGGEGISASDQQWPSSEGGSHHGPTSKTVIGTIMGTARYMAPEQAAGQTQLADPSWDVWAIGVLAHELLVGQPPASSQAPHSLLDPRTPDNPAPRTLRPTLDPELERILQKCLARDTIQRYRDANELANDLHRWLEPPVKQRWWPWAAAAAGITLAVLLTIRWWPKPQPAPIDQAEELVKKIQTTPIGAPIPLLGATGHPAHRRVVMGKEFVAERLWVTDQAFTVDTQRGVLLELVPPAGAIYGYRMSGKVRLNDDSDRSGRAGFMVAGWPGQADVGATYSFLELGVSHRHSGDKPRFELPPGANRMAFFTLRGWLYGDIPETTREITQPTIFSGLHRVVDNVPHAGMDEVYRELVIEVTPEGVTAYAEGQLIAHTPARMVAQVMAALEEDTPLQRPYQYNPCGPLGLFVWHASASFKDIRLEVLVPVNP